MLFNSTELSTSSNLILCKAFRRLKTFLMSKYPCFERFKHVISLEAYGKWQSAPFRKQKTWKLSVFLSKQLHPQGRASKNSIARSVKFPCFPIRSWVFAKTLFLFSSEQFCFCNHCARDNKRSLFKLCEKREREI